MVDELVGKKLTNPFNYMQIYFSFKDILCQLEFIHLGICGLS